MITYYIPDSHEYVLNRYMVYDWDRDQYYTRVESTDELLEFKQKYDL